MRNNKSFWTLNKEGTLVLRDLESEHIEFSVEKYRRGECDSINYQWYEMFDHYVHDDNGCDYERYGCTIEPGDVVLDLGANIGIFAHRAESRGASQVISFEPITPTFECLLRNKGEKTIVYKNAVGNFSGFSEFLIHSDFTNVGGGSSMDQDHSLEKRDVIYKEKVYVLDINHIFETFKKIDFLKVDIEGGEVYVLDHIKDENLKSLRCISAEFHRTYPEFEEFQKKFMERIHRLGFKSFILYHGDGSLRTVNIWK